MDYITETDMDKVRGIAKELLEVPVCQIPGMPFVTHPILSCTLYPMNNDFNSCVDITEDAAAMEQVKADIRRRIDDCDSITQIGASIIDKKYRLLFLKLCEGYASRTDVGLYLNQLWCSVENIIGDPNVTQKDIIRLFKLADPTVLMSENDQKALETLPDTVTVYRGIRKTLLISGKRMIDGFSWSTGMDTAYWFARRFAHCQEEMGRVFRAEIRKEFILAYFGVDGFEREVVVTPYRLRNITEIPVEYRREI